MSILKLADAAHRVEHHREWGSIAEPVVKLEKLTYVGNPVASMANRSTSVRGIEDSAVVTEILRGRHVGMVASMIKASLHRLPLEYRSADGHFSLY